MEISNGRLISQTLVNRMLVCINDYELIKAKANPRFKTVKEFCKYNKFSHQNFMRVYHRYKENPEPYSLVPQKRGPKYKSRRGDLETAIDSKIVELRNLGNNRYEIKDILKKDFGDSTPSASTIYNILCRYGMNKLTKPQQQNRRKIIMERIGELVHIDLSQLSSGLMINQVNNIYFVGVIDGYSRTAWVEVVENKKSLTVMFAVLKAFNILQKHYGIEAEAVLTDNGAEFGSGKKSKNKDANPFERLLFEMDIKHRYTRPYRPQTNGKIERFWKTIKSDFVEGALYENIDDLKKELLEYLIYYNEYRPHSSLDNQTPKSIVNTKIQTKKSIIK